jgi:hypothetical protein
MLSPSTGDPVNTDCPPLADVGPVLGAGKGGRHQGRELHLARPTGLMGYRLAADEEPRTGMPELFHAEAWYKRAVFDTAR